MGDRFVCIHGHFYQPPRENPWLEEVEIEDSAYPYHDWNRRITAECYAPNSASRIMDAEGRIVSLVNNYSRMSFNFGPTLMYWLQEHEQEVYQNIIDADRESTGKSAEKGSAVAQVYNHMIMPLANERDKQTQVKWGIQDFRERFNRLPEGMWLPETAVNIETLEVLAENGIEFTILGQHQAAKQRKIGETEWTDISGGKIDPRHPFLCRLPSGRTIALFFYDEAIAHDMGFGTLLESGKAFAERIASAFENDSEEAALVSLATDGEMYGHHRPHGDMALAYCLYYLETNGLAKVTNYSEFLQKHPPTHEVEIIENTSWSCTHGIERWRNDCGCNMGKPGWRQLWRKPLREAMDWLRDRLAQEFEQEASKFLKDPWSTRNDYIEIVLDRLRTQEKIDEFLLKHSINDLKDEEKRRVIKLLEMQRNAMLMFTSCGWFFDEISGLESVQIMKYASRAIQLAREVLGKDFEPEYVKMLEQAPSNITEFENGSRTYDSLVRPAAVDLVKVGVHLTMMTLFANGTVPANSASVFSTCCFGFSNEMSETSDAGKFRLVTSQTRITSKVTLDEALVGSAAIWLGDHNVSCGVKVDMSEEAFKAMHDEVMGAFKKGLVNEAIMLLSKHFGGSTYSVKDLLKDYQRSILEFVIRASVKKATELYEVIYNDNSATMRFMNEVKAEPPRLLRYAVNVILSSEIRKALSSENMDLELLDRLVTDSKLLSAALDTDLISLEASDRISREMTKLVESPDDLKRLEEVERLATILGNLPMPLNLWKSQNLAFKIARDPYVQIKQRSDENSRKWVSAFEHLAQSLGIRLD